jgi:hypothetical protein
MQNSLPFAPRFSIWHLTAIWRPLRFFTSIASTEQRDRSKKGEPFCGRRLIPGHDMVCSAGIVTRSALPFPETEAFPLTETFDASYRARSSGSSGLLSGAAMSRTPEISQQPRIFTWRL